MATFPHAYIGYHQRVKLAASAHGRRMANASWKKRRAERAPNPHEVDADTVRERALHDRMGALIMAGTHANLGHVQIRYSTRRTNGYELWINGRLTKRAGKRKIMEELI